MKNFLSALVLSALVAGQASAANIAYVSVKGAKQGVFKGEIVSPLHKDSIGVVGFSFEIVSPRDPASGLPTGKRQHKPVVISKEWGASSPQFLTALASNEILNTVTIEFYESTSTGTEIVASTVRLTNASVTDVKQTFLNLPGEAAATIRNLQEISLTFQKIEITDRSGTTYVDDWNAPALE